MTCLFTLVFSLAFVGHIFLGSSGGGAGAEGGEAAPAAGAEAEPAVRRRLLEYGGVLVVNAGALLVGPLGMG